MKWKLARDIKAISEASSSLQQPTNELQTYSSCEEEVKRVPWANAWKYA